MESLFPGILFLGPIFTPLIIRLGLALLFFTEAFKLSKGGPMEKVRSLWALLLTLLLAVGLLTQLAALAGIVYIAISLFFAKKSSPVFVSKTTAFLGIVMLLTLVISGAGYTPFPFADVPY